MRRVLIIIAITISAFITPKAYSQNYISIGTTNYLSTPIWEFSDKNATVCIGKKATGGIIMLTINNTGSGWYILGDIYIYLDDLCIIKCTDRGLRHNADENTMSAYYLTPSEIQSLKKSNIKEIAYTLYDGISYYNYTMKNSYVVQVPVVHELDANGNYYPINTGYEIRSNPTALDVIKLFGGI